MKRQQSRKFFVIFSFLLFPITIYYFSPYLIIQAASIGIIAGCTAVFITQFILSIFLGRAFCGWVCPAGGLQEICTLVNNKEINNVRANIIKYVIWVVWVLTIAAIFIRTKNTIKIDLLYQTVNGISVSSPEQYIIYYGVALLIAITALMLGRRAFCHYLCWMAPFMVYGTKIAAMLNTPALRLKAESSKCVSCKQCNKVCQMCLDVNSMVLQNNMYNSECILCGECIDKCPKKAIKYNFGSR